MRRRPRTSSNLRSRTARVLVPVLALSCALTVGLFGCDEDNGGPEPLPELDPIVQHWPRFRGPGGQGHLASATAPLAWDESASEGILWTTPVPLRGASSPVVCGNLVFLTGADAATREVYCYDADSGELLWRRSVATGTSPAQTTVWDSTNNITYAASTPIMDGQWVFAIFGNGDVAAFDYEGRRAWVRSLGLPENGFGHSASLALHGDLLIVQLDQDKEWDGGAGEWVINSKLLALNKRTGQTVWEKSGADRPVGTAWSSPIIINAAGRDQLITCARRVDPPTGLGAGLFSYDPATGEEIWRADCLGDVDVVASPVYVDGLVIAIGMGGTVAIRPDGTGDVTATHVQWTLPGGSWDGPSPAGTGQLVFAVTANGALTCLKTDETSPWSDSTSLSGAGFLASPVVVGDRVYAQRKDGVMFVFSVTDTGYAELDRGTLLDDFCSASPAFALGRIYIRSKDDLYCIGN